MDTPKTTIEDSKQALLRYKPEDVLRHCHEWSLKLSGQRMPMQVSIPRHVSRHGIAYNINIAPYYVALIARVSLLVSSRLAIHRLTSDSFLRLLSIVSELYEPINDPVQFFIQTAYEQFWYQNLKGRAIPRALLLFKDACKKIRNPKFDIPNDFERQFGITIEDFTAIGFIFFAAARKQNTPIMKLPIRFQSEKLSKRLTREKVEAFLAFNSANQDKFKETAKTIAISGTGDNRYDFNPLFKFPLIELEHGGFIAPLPDLIAWRIYNGPFMELRDANIKDRAKENPFSAFFGEVFEQYVGLVLENTFPKEAILPEVEYSKPRKKGPDWIVRLGDKGIAIECTNSTLTLPTKTLATPEQVCKDVKDKYISKIRKLPGKINELMKRASPYFDKLRGISQWHYLLVYRQLRGPLGFFSFRASFSGNFMIKVGRRNLNI